MKRLNNMKMKMKPIAAAVALTLTSAPVWAVQDFYLAAKAFDKTLPDGTVVTMWGYAEDAGGTCFNTTTSVADRLACVDGLTATAPGPRLTVTDPTDPNIRIFLTNALPEPTSIIIPGQRMPQSNTAGGTTNYGPTWDDGSDGARPSSTARVRSFGKEASANGGRNVYRWVNAQNTPLDTTGTLLYHSGTTPQKQVYMGLAGLVTRDAAAGEVYPGVAYANEVTLFYSDIDPAFNAAVAAGTLTTAIDRHPTWFLINGEPFNPTAVDETGPSGIAAGEAGSNTLLRLASMTTDTHVAVLQGLNMAIHAEDGHPYNWQELGGSVTHAVPRTQYSAMLPPAKTKDAIVVAPADGTFAVYDGNGYMSNPSSPTNEAVGDSVGGMVRFLAFGVPSNLLPTAVADSNSGLVGDPALTGNVLSNDTLGDPTTTVTGASQGVTPITLGSPFVTAAGNELTLNADGSYSYSTVAAGSDVIDYTITDGNGDSSSSTLTLTVNNVVLLPIATPQSVILDEDTVQAITLGGQNGGTFAIVTGPTNGTLGALNIDQVSYTPNADYNGADSFTFTVSDGVNTSDPATVSLTVNPVNDAPVADAQSLSTDQGVAIPVTLTGSDVDGDPLTFTVATNPTGGVLGGTAPNLTYTPNTGFNGADSFTFTVNDGIVDSLAATVDITVNAVGATTATIAFSTAGAGAVPGVSGPYDDADIYSVVVNSDETANVYSKLYDAVSTLGLPNNANIDGMEIDGATVYVSFARSTTSVTGVGNVNDEDIVMYSGGSWSAYFSGSQCNLDASNAGDIDALSVVGSTIYFSTVGNANVAGLGAADDADIYSWNGSACSRVMDASAIGLPGNADIDGLSVVGGTYYISFSADTAVPGLGTVPDQAVVSYDGANWALVFTGTGQLDGSNSQNLDAIDVQ